MFDGRSEIGRLGQFDGLVKSMERSGGHMMRNRSDGMTGVREQLTYFYIELQYPSPPEIKVAKRRFRHDAISAVTSRHGSVEKRIVAEESKEIS